VGILTQSALTSMAVAQGRVLVGEIDGKVHSFSASDGQWQWSAETHGQSGLPAPLIIGDQVFVLRGGERARLYRLALASGLPHEAGPIDLPVPATRAEPGRQYHRNFVVSSPAGTEDILVLGLRTDDRFDSNGDGAADGVLAEEQVLGLSPSDGRIRWTVANGSLDSSQVHLLPNHGMVPTPALFPGAGGQAFIAVASTLSPRLRLLAATDGQEHAALGLPAPTRGSPLLANGRLVIGTDAGTVHSFPSRTNRPPATACATRSALTTMARSCATGRSGW
jgi:outer membrane protein assembly factor BamB